jgi:hypothetical protein
MLIGGNSGRYDHGSCEANQTPGAVKSSVVSGDTQAAPSDAFHSPLGGMSPPLFSALKFLPPGDVTHKSAQAISAECAYGEI